MATIYKENNILFWNPCEDPSCAPSTGNNNGTTVALNGDGNIAKVIDYFSGNNPYGVSLSNEAIAGILANFQAESGFSPFRNQDKAGYTAGEYLGGGYGIAQFTPRSKILDALKTDSRTSSYYQKYYEEGTKTYGGKVSDGGIPSGVPEEVNDAFLAVELDYITTTEGLNTKVKSYRNSGGSMGLDYIDGDLTLYEALNEAKTASDATRIFVWIYERPGDKAGAAESRSKNAENYLATVEGLRGTSNSNSKKSSSNSYIAAGGIECKEEEDEADADIIAKTAIELAWPNDDGTSCGNVYTNSWDWDHRDNCKNSIKESYQQAANSVGNAGVDLRDCARFVGTVIRHSGADPDFPAAITYNQHDYLRSSSKWSLVTDGSPKSGDVLINTSGGTHHVMIYVGDAYGKSNVYASASQGTRSSNLTLYNTVPSGYEVYRLN